MTDDPNKPASHDQNPDNFRLPAWPAPDAEPDDHEDLRALFRATAPTVSSVDVEALFRRFVRPFSWRPAMAFAMKIAAAALLAAGGWFYFLVLPSAEATAFAEAAQKLRNAHTLSYRVTTESPDIKLPLTLRFLFKEPSLMRTETEGGVITILDGSQGQQLLLDKNKKTALLMEGKGQQMPDGAGNGMIDRLRKLTDGDAKHVGEKPIGGVRALGYLVKNLGFEMTVWVDPATRLPVRFEMSDRFQGKEVKSTASDFQIDPDLEDALFRIEVPAGYTLRKAESDYLGMDEKTFLNPEKAAEDLLRKLAKKTGGTFPKKLDDFAELDQLFPRKPGVIPDAEGLSIAQSLGRFLMATRTLKGGFGYRSEGVRLGDADKILFWYQPEGATKYRALYGDLHVADVTEDKLPEKPKR
jgi:outer membrane lipoprotein-sorting protein